MSNISDLIDRRGEEVQIYRRSSSSVDEFNRPRYSWALQATEKAFVQAYKWDMGVGELILQAGEITADDRIGFFRADSSIHEDDQVVHDGVRYDVQAVRLKRVGGATQLKVAMMKRILE